MYLFKLLYIHAVHVLQVAPRTRVTHNIIESICRNIPYEIINEMR